MQKRPTLPTTERSQMKAPHDTDFAKRFRLFRETYVDKTQSAAAEKLGTTQANISNIESGRRKPNVNLIRTLVSGFNLNMEWLDKGIGNKQMERPVQSTASTSLSAAHDEISILRKLMEQYDANQTHFMKLIEKQGSRIDALEREIDELKRNSK